MSSVILESARGKAPSVPHAHVVTVPACDWCGGCGCIPTADNELHPCPECDPHGGAWAFGLAPEPVPPPVLTAEELEQLTLIVRAALKRAGKDVWEVDLYVHSNAREQGPADNPGVGCQVRYSRPYRVRDDHYSFHPDPLPPRVSRAWCDPDPINSYEFPAPTPNRPRRKTG